MLMWFLIILLVVFVVLGVMLCIAFVRLGRELRQLGDHTESLSTRIQRTTQTVQVIIPLVALARQAGETLWSKRRQLTKKGKK